MPKRAYPTIPLASSSTACTKDHVHGKCTNLPTHGQLIMVLMWLRLGLLEKALAFRLGVSASGMSRIFVKWVHFTYIVSSFGISTYTPNMGFCSKDNACLLQGVISVNICNR